MIGLDQLISSPANAAVGLLSQSTHDGRFLLTVTEVTRVSISKHREVTSAVLAGDHELAS